MARKKAARSKPARKRPLMTRAEGREYLARWERVNEFQLAERKAKTPTQRFRDVMRMMRWAKALGFRSALEREEALARDVWNKLCRLLSGRA